MWPAFWLTGLFFWADNTTLQTFIECMSKIDRNIQIYRHARYDCKLWNAIWFYSVFWAFSYIIIDHSCLNCWISTKLLQIMCLINTHILVYQHANVTAGYERFSDLIAFLRIFILLHVWNVITSSNFYCVLRQRCWDEK